MAGFLPSKASPTRFGRGERIGRVCDDRRGRGGDRGRSCVRGCNASEGRGDTSIGRGDDVGRDHGVGRRYHVLDVIVRHGEDVGNDHDARCGVPGSGGRGGSGHSVGGSGWQSKRR